MQQRVLTNIGTLAKINVGVFSGLQGRFSDAHDGHSGVIGLRVDRQYCRSSLEHIGIPPEQKRLPPAPKHPSAKAVPFWPNMSRRRLEPEMPCAPGIAQKISIASS